MKFMSALIAVVVSGVVSGSPQLDAAEGQQGRSFGSARRDEQIALSFLSSLPAVPQRRVREQLRLIERLKREGADSGRIWIEMLRWRGRAFRNQPDREA